MRHVVRCRLALWVGPCAKNLQRLVLRRRRESDERDARIIRPSRHLRRENILRAHLSTVAQLGEFLRRKHRLQLGRSLARLRAVRFVGDHCEAFSLRCCQLAHRFQRKRERLDRADHDLLRAIQRGRQLRALAPVVALDRRHYPALPLEIEQRFLQLRINHRAVRHHQHRIEHLLVLRIVQLREKMRRPRDAVRLPRARRVLHQILPADPIHQHRSLEFSSYVELMKPRENHPGDLLLLVPLRDEIPAENFQPAFPRPHLLPQIRCAMPACRVHRIPRRALIALVERQELRRLPLQLRHHRHLAIAHRKMHQRSAWESQQRLAFRLPVKTILIDRVADALREIRLKLHGRHRQPVEEKHEVDAVFIAQRVSHLPHHPQSVRSVSREDLGIDRERRFKLRQLQRLLQPQQLHALPHYIQSPALVHLFPQSRQQRLTRLRSVILLQRLPSLWLRCLHPCQNIRGEKRPRPVVARRIPLGI